MFCECRQCCRNQRGQCLISDQVTLNEYGLCKYSAATYNASKCANPRCPECGEELECMCVIGADESRSGRTELLYLCNECLSSWETTEKEDGSNRSEPKRYFFG